LSRKFFFRGDREICDFYFFQSYLHPGFFSKCRDTDSADSICRRAILLFYCVCKIWDARAAVQKQD
jgi:hypothetical protein